MDKNSKMTNRKCPECGTYLNWLLVAKKYDCPKCGWDGDSIDLEMDESIEKLLNL